MRSQPRSGHATRTLLTGLALIGLIAAGFWAWQIARRAQELAAAVARVEAVGLDPARWPELCARAAETDAAAGALRSSAGPLLALSAGLAGLPRYGPQVAAAGPLLDAAQQLGVAAARGCAALEGLTAPLPPDRPAPAVLTERLAAARPELNEARAALERAGAAIATVDRSTLPAEQGERLGRAEELLARARAALELAVVAPGLLGADGPRSYLVAVQNPDELRPTGGFISAAGVVRVEQGRPIAFDLRDSARLDNLAGAYPLAPEPMRRYMLSQPMALALWVFRDANWSPDFPTAARQMLDLYAIGTGERAEAVLALTPDAVRAALSATGPVRIEGRSATVDAANIEEALRAAYDDAREQGRPEERKSFVNRLGAALLTRVSELEPEELFALARAVEGALDERAAQIYLPAGDPAAALIAARGWDGAVRPGAQDFLMVVSANVGFTKVGPNIDQRISYALDLSDPALPRGAVTVEHTNRSVGEAGCTPPRGGNLATYAELTNGCYWNYLRVFVPAEATLYDAEVPIVPDEWMRGGNGDDGRVYGEFGPTGTRAYAALVVVPRAATQRVTFRYELPATVQTAEDGSLRYRLQVQRQPGLAQPLIVQVLLPAGAELLTATPSPQRRAGQIFTFELSQETDEALELRYRLR